MPVTWSISNYCTLIYLSHFLALVWNHSSTSNRALSHPQPFKILQGVACEPTSWVMESSLGLGWFAMDCHGRKMLWPEGPVGMSSLWEIPLRGRESQTPILRYRISSRQKPWPFDENTYIYIFGTIEWGIGNGGMGFVSELSIFRTFFSCHRRLSPVPGSMRP